MVKDRKRQAAAYRGNRGRLRRRLRRAWGWFTEYYFELQTWAETPSWLKPWAEHEMSARTLRSWSPVVVPGLMQTAAYAEAQMSHSPGITPERLAERVANRMARQKRVLYRDDPPHAHFLVDITSLRRMPAHVTSGQLRHLLDAARQPNITIQVVPECWHAGMSGGFILTDTAAYAESVTTGHVYSAGDENGFRPGTPLRYPSYRGHEGERVPSPHQGDDQP